MKTGDHFDCSYNQNNLQSSLIIHIRSFDYHFIDNNGFFLEALQEISYLKSIDASLGPEIPYLHHYFLQYAVISGCLEVKCHSTAKDRDESQSWKNTANNFHN